MRSKNDEPNGTSKNGSLTLANAKGMFEHLLNELNYYKEQFEIEKNIKNNLYAFILNEGLFKELEDYHHKTDMRSPDGHLRAMTLLCLNLPEEAN